MKEYDFYDIYSDCLKQLSEKLDSYLQGLWKEIDYTRVGCRTEIDRFENKLRIFFGDDNTRNHYQFSLAYEIVDENKLKITDVLYFSNERAYSNKVMELKDIVLKGKIKKDLLEEELKQLQRIKEQQECSIKDLEENIRIKKIEVENINQQMSDIKNELSK